MSVAREALEAISANRDSLAVLAGIVSSLAALIALAITARAMVRQARSMDAASYLDFVDRITSALRKISAAAPENQEFEANELFNLLEGLAQLYLRRRFGRLTRRMVRQLLIEALAFVETSQVLEAPLARAMSSPTMFSALETFQRKHRDTISRHR